jgi:hypothetical protein
MQSDGRCGEASLLGDRDEVLQVTQLLRATLSIFAMDSIKDIRWS